MNLSTDFNLDGSVFNGAGTLGTPAMRSKMDRGREQSICAIDDDLVQKRTGSGPKKETAGKPAAESGDRPGQIRCNVLVQMLQSGVIRCNFHVSIKA